MADGNAENTITNSKDSLEGRPTVMTEDVVKILIACFQRGLTDTIACQEAGITRQTFYNHMKSNVDFFDKITRAKNLSIVLAGGRVAKVLEKGNDRDASKVAMWLLERRVPELYGTKIQVNSKVRYVPPTWFEEIEEADIVPNVTK